MLMVEGGGRRAYFENLSFKLWSTKVRNSTQYIGLAKVVYNGDV